MTLIVPLLCHAQDLSCRGGRPNPDMVGAKKNPQALVEGLRIERLGERVLSDYFTSNIIFLAILVDHDLIVPDKLLRRHHALVVFYYIDTC